MLRVVTWSGGRCRIVESRRDEATVGADPGCDVRVRGFGVAARHLTLLARRGRVIACPAEAARLVRRGARVVAPVVLEPGEALAVGPHRVVGEARSEADCGWTEVETDVGEVELEVGDPEPGVRRYLTRDSAWEITVPDATPPEAWFRRLESAYPGGRRLAAPGPAFAVPLPPGGSAAELVHAVTTGGLRIPVEALVVIAAQISARLEGWDAPHGALGPDRVWLTRRGDAIPLPPGPAPSLVGDRTALGALVARLDPDQRRPLWLDEALAGSSFSVVEAASRDNLDPAAHHLARVVAVLEAAKRVIP